jgi:hypothetical protein
LGGRFSQFSLQGAAMHIQRTGGRGDVAIVFVEYPLDVFPFQISD